MRILFPEIRPYATQYLAVDSLHTLHVEECGNPEGLPVLFLHGGPGGGCESLHRRFFNPQHYRIVLFDQRGCGRSTPHAGLQDNTTWHLVADIETLRRHLHIDRWVVFGGSWGTTLALAYAEAYPERVQGLILRGVFLCRDRDIHWFYQEGANRLFPDQWEHFVAPIPSAERDDLLQAYYQRLTGDNALERLRVAKAWSVWEGSTLTLESDARYVQQFAEAHRALSLARIECHYFVNHAFLEPDQLLRDAYRLRDIAGYIIHGRYDVICPLDNAWALHHAWPEAELRIIGSAGHAASEPGIVDALVTATEHLAGQLA
ncbi:MAG: prolyl aminopeptidase [Candidatus Contendobacter odensis]|uniref:Proline iminopeptidase n=1 Tax=Candidatus Contendibacter odensensis TaxID=1400860 RepID=A0A2G6PFS5_9GAMM|nr:MAG: prolyl aminopeptidase [Candidatus Contendobacter odensis]